MSTKNTHFTAAIGQTSLQYTVCGIVLRTQNIQYMPLFSLWKDEGSDSSKEREKDGDWDKREFLLHDPVKVHCISHIYAFSSHPVVFTGTSYKIQCKLKEKRRTKGKMGDKVKRLNRG